MTRPLYIFDLDGTLADAEHRIHFIRRPACPFCGWIKLCDHDQLTDEQLREKGLPPGQRAAFVPDWRAFFAACMDDKPILAALATLRALRHGGAECWIWTGRSDEVREETRAWLKKHGAWHSWRFTAPEAFLMREAGDHRPDHELKLSWLSALEPPERARLIAVFEDRAAVVQMWRAYGVPCFQVAPGDF